MSMYTLCPVFIAAKPEFWLVLLNRQSLMYARSVYASSMRLIKHLQYIWIIKVLYN